MQMCDCRIVTFIFTVMIFVTMVCVLDARHPLMIVAETWVYAINHVFVCWVHGGDCVDITLLSGLHP